MCVKVCLTEMILHQCVSQKKMWMLKPVKDVCVCGYLPMLMMKVYAGIIRRSEVALIVWCPDGL